MNCLHLNANTGKFEKVLCAPTGVAKHYPVYSCDLYRECLPTYVPRKREFWESLPQSKRLTACFHCQSKENHP